MNNIKSVNLGDSVFTTLDTNSYLNELYDDILYTYSMNLFGLENGTPTTFNINDALRFADLLSKSNSQKNSDKHKIWAQEIVALLHFLYPHKDIINYYMGSVLSNIGNYRGMDIVTPMYQSRTLLDNFYIEFSKDLLKIPAEPKNHFFRSQKAVYDHLSEPYFSYSGPTSMGKSFVMRMFIKKQILDGVSANFTILVPTKALINEVTSKIINDLKDLLAECNYRLVTSASALSLNHDHNFIFVLTPERLLYLLISNPNIIIDHLFIDEAHKISSKESRSAFYYKVVDMLSRRERKPHIIFSSPNIPNPEIYLDLIPTAMLEKKKKISTSFTPVSQVKYLVDFPSRTIHQYNTYNKKLKEIASIKSTSSFCQLIEHIGANSQNIVYCNSINKAIELARKYTENMEPLENSDLLTLSRDIKKEVHGDYYLADVISKGVAYHIGYLPSALRMRIEELFKNGFIKTMFCTSTLVEGVNLPADNLFITHYRNGLSKMTSVDFKNLVGRVGRIEYNLYGNVFLVRLEDSIKSKEFVDLLKEEIPDQKLSIKTELSKPQKKLIIDCLLQGNVELLRHPKTQTTEEYALMRKFSIILLSDITKGNDSLVRREFSSFLNANIEEKIKNAFNKITRTPDDDINFSIDQSSSLAEAIAAGLKYPALNSNGNIDYQELLVFLEKLCKIFKWEIYEKQTLGNVGIDGSHGKLRWYAVILSQWIKGTGLSYIMEQTLRYKRAHKTSGVNINGKLEDYDDTVAHRNIIISETLRVIEHVILFSISNYFLRFSSEYKRFHKLRSFQNDWYEYVEYGTTHPLSIILQRNGFSRETSTYIKSHKDDYVVSLKNGEYKLRRSLTSCSNASVRKEVMDIRYNTPELFV